MKSRPEERLLMGILIQNDRTGSRYANPARLRSIVAAHISVYRRAISIHKSSADNCSEKQQPRVYLLLTSNLESLLRGNPYDGARFDAGNLFTPCRSYANRVTVKTVKPRQFAIDEGVSDNSARDYPSESVRHRYIHIGQFR